MTLLVKDNSILVKSNSLLVKDSNNLLVKAELRLHISSFRFCNSIKKNAMKQWKRQQDKVVNFTFSYLCSWLLFIEQCMTCATASGKKEGLSHHAKRVRLALLVFTWFFVSEIKGFAVPGINESRVWRRRWVTLQYKRKKTLEHYQSWMRIRSDVEETVFLRKTKKQLSKSFLKSRKNILKKVHCLKTVLLQPDLRQPLAERFLTLQL